MSILITKEDCERGRQVRLRDGSFDRLRIFDSGVNSVFPVLTVSGNWYRINGRIMAYSQSNETDIVAFIDEDEKELPPKKKRKIIQISGDSIPYVLCDDGTFWEWRGGDIPWRKLPDIPQDDGEGEKK